MVNKKLFLSLLLMLLGCTSIAQKNYIDLKDYIVPINIEPIESVDSSVQPSTRSIIAALFPDIDTFADQLKVATIAASIASPLACITSFIYTDKTSCWPVIASLGESIGFWALCYYHFNYINRKASDKQIQQFVQRMQQAQPKKQEVCAICFENGNDKPLYSLLDCSCSFCFDIDCIVSHIQTTPLRLLKCPVCRIQIDMNVDTKSLTKRDPAVSRS